MARCLRRQSLASSAFPTLPMSPWKGRQEGQDLVISQAPQFSPTFSWFTPLPYMPVLTGWVGHRGGCNLGDGHNLQQNKIPNKKKSSYSSLQRLILCKFAWKSDDRPGPRPSFPPLFPFPTLPMSPWKGRQEGQDLVISQAPQFPPTFSWFPPLPYMPVLTGWVGHRGGCNSGDGHNLQQNKIQNKRKASYPSLQRLIVCKFAWKSDYRPGPRPSFPPFFPPADPPPSGGGRIPGHQVQAPLAALTSSPGEKSCHPRSVAAPDASINK